MHHRVPRQRQLRPHPAPNLLLLLVVSFLPFPTKLLAGTSRESDAARVASTVYGLNLLATAVAVGVLWGYAVRAGLVRLDAEDQDVRTLLQTADAEPGRVRHGPVIGVGLFLPVLALLGYLALAVYILVPLRASGAGGRGAGSPVAG